MCYILPVNANILSATGTNYNAVFFATAICSCICWLLMGLIANLPVALSAGMGVSAFIAFTVWGTMGYSFEQSKVLVLIAYCAMMLVSKRGKEVPVIIYGVAGFFILNYILNTIL